MYQWPNTQIQLKLPIIYFIKKYEEIEKDKQAVVTRLGNTYGTNFENIKTTGKYNFLGNLRP